MYHEGVWGLLYRGWWPILETHDFLRQFLDLVILLSVLLDDGSQEFVLLTN